MSRAATLSRKSYNRTYQAGRYQRRRAAGLCVDCSAPTGGACRCDACSVKAADKSRANLRRRRPAWKALGVCTVCGCREAIKGQAWCAVCAERHTESVRDARRRKTAIAA